MKRLFLMALLIPATILLPSYVCEAKDVWVDQEVRNGDLIRIVHWTFSKYKSDMWRYETSTMRGDHTTVVLPKNQIFEFCMDSLGWPYYIKEYWYY